MFWRQVLASDSKGAKADRNAGHRNHFRLLGEEGRSWSGREPNVLFLNRGDGTFEETANIAGLALRLDSRGAAAGDLDGDGDLDLVVYNRNNPIVKIYRNDTPGQGNVLLVDLVAPAGTSNPGAIGAQVILRCGDHKMIRQVEAGSGFLSQGAATLHFGLGGCRVVDALEIRWPSGHEQRLEKLPANHRIRVTEGVAAHESTPLRPRNFNRDETAPVAAEMRSAPRPDLAFPRLFETGELALESLDAGTVLLNFWATWCAACAAEQEDLLAIKASFAARGVRFVAVCMNERSEAKKVRTFLDEHEFAFEHVWGGLEKQRPFASLAGSPVGVLPLTVVVHRGVIRYVRAGRIDPAVVTSLLERLVSRDRDR